MKRTILAAAFCLTLLLVFGSAALNESARAQTDVITDLLDLPAPPPPNPLVRNAGVRPPEFYDKEKPPPDDAPIDDLLDYWAHQSSSYSVMNYTPKPSARVLGRLKDAIGREPEQLMRFLNVFREGKEQAEFVKSMYDAMLAKDDGKRDYLGTIKRWMTYNTPYFADELERMAGGFGEDREYVRGDDEILALARVDWQRAAPSVNRAYNDHSQPVSRAVALWALYRNALDNDSIGDVDRYRSELMAIVEDRAATNGARDMALDALVMEKDWSGRDDWYFSLMADETLADLMVNGSRNTGLTTIISHMPAGHFREKMIELAGSDNKTVRSAAVRNLQIIMRQDRTDEEIVRAMLPWLRDPDWVETHDSGRTMLIQSLQTIKMPEAVPALIALLEEKETREVPDYGSAANAANAAANAANMAANAIRVYTTNTATVINTNSVSNTWGDPSVKTRTEIVYPYRWAAIQALVTQADMRAVPALRRMLAMMTGYERTGVVSALLASGGFTIPEQVDALVAIVRAVDAKQDELIAEARDSIANSGGDAADLPERYLREQIFRSAYYRVVSYSDNEVSVPQQIGGMLIANNSPSEELVRAVLDRIGQLERREPTVADGLRSILRRWPGTAVNAMLLRELKDGKLGFDGIVKLLSVRKELSEKQMTDVMDAGSGNRTAAAVAMCIAEDRMALESALDGDTETAMAALACARLIRAPLDVDRVAALIDSDDARLALAAERYLESEDSGEARAVVLARNPGKAKILGATTHFAGSEKRPVYSEFLGALFESVESVPSVGAGMAGSYGIMTLGAGDEATLQKEVLENEKLLGVYSYDDNFVRIYADRVMYSSKEDDARYRERPLTGPEFEDLKDIITHHRADELKPFISCSYECEPKQLIMLGRNGGRRVYVRAERMPEFFAELDSYFGALKSRPMQLKYAAGKELAGLEVLFADDDVEAQTVWKNGDDLRVLFTDNRVRERVEEEISSAVEAAEERFYSGLGLEGVDSAEDKEVEEEAPYVLAERLQRQRMNEGVVWYSFGDSGPIDPAAPPPGFNIPSTVNASGIPSEIDGWKRTARNVEVRVEEDGLHRISAGKETRIFEGNYHEPHISTDGRWLVAMKYSAEYRVGLVRIDLGNNREYTIAADEERFPGRPVGYIAAINRFVIMIPNYNYGHHYGYDDEGMPLAEGTFALLDPTTGEVRAAPGEVRPIAQQTFRPLQQAADPATFWAALPDRAKGETAVGIYDSKFMNFKPLLRVPNMIFTSMDMWVDQPGGKVFFVYKGHLLSAPLPRP